MHPIFIFILLNLGYITEGETKATLFHISHKHFLTPTIIVIHIVNNYYMHWFKH
jgi:hypothetical protein